MSNRDVDRKSEDRSYQEIRNHAINRQKHAMNELSKGHDPETKAEILESIKERSDMIRYLNNHVDQNKLN